MLPLANMQWIIVLFIGSMSQNWTKIGEGGGNTNFSCNYCQCILKGFYSSMMSHLCMDDEIPLIQSQFQ
jgi:hypothetical protein